MGKPTFTAFQIALRACSGRRIGRLDEVCWAEYIGSNKQTRGTETSQYPEERTSTETPLVVASEQGPGQCSSEIKSNGLERPAIVGDSPVDVKQDETRVGRDT